MRLKIGFCVFSMGSIKLQIRLNDGQIWPNGLP
jgi:hypothetical protein